MCQKCSFLGPRNAPHPKAQEWRPATCAFLRSPVMQTHTSVWGLVTYANIRGRTALTCKASSDPYGNSCHTTHKVLSELSVYLSSQYVSGGKGLLPLCIMVTVLNTVSPKLKWWSIRLTPTTLTLPPFCTCFQQLEVLLPEPFRSWFTPHVPLTPLTRVLGYRGSATCGRCPVTHRPKWAEPHYRKAMLGGYRSINSH